MRSGAKTFERADGGKVVERGKRSMNNYILPFLWMRGEKEEVIREEMGRIDSCGIKAVCVEARPHKDFCGPG